jgi:PAS domain S-box-containing protein
MVDRAGRVTAVLAVAHDVTAHKRADAALRESEQRYRSVVEQTNDAVVIHRDDGVVVFANTAAGKMVSLPEGESLVGRLVTDFIAPESLAFALRRVADALSSERPLPAADETLVTLEGRRLQVEIIGQRINYDGKVAVLITIRDSSERRRLETQMHRAQKLESLGALAGGVAHDFNNLLQAMIGYANLARRGLPPTSDALGPLKNIETAAHRAAELTRQLRSYAGEGAGVATRVDLAALVREMAELLRVSVPQHAALDLDLAPDTPPAFGDPTQIRQVIMNLIVNASEALGTRGGRIRVLCRPVQADQALLARAYVDDRLREGEYVCVEVQDDGCGIDEETIARLFDPFFSTKSSGRGLGLAATLGIVRKHHGAVFVESQPGSGSKFTVLFPRAADSTKCDAEPQALPPR